MRARQSVEPARPDVIGRVQSASDTIQVDSMHGYRASLFRQPELPNVPGSISQGAPSSTVGSVRVSPARNRRIVRAKRSFPTFELALLAECHNHVAGSDEFQTPDCNQQ